MNQSTTPQPAGGPFRCARCGMESTIREAFVFKKSIFGSRKIVCFQCEAKETARLLGLELLVFPLAGLLLYLLDPRSWFTQFYLYVGVVLVLLIPLSALHELAHVIVGSLAGFRVFSMHLGMGRVIHTTRFLGIQWVLHVMPAGGMTMLAAPELVSYRLRAAFTYLAGPALHAVLAISLWMLAPLVAYFSPPPPVSILWSAAIGVNVLLLITNLIPWKGAAGPGVAGSDGRALLELGRRSEKEMRLRYAGYYVLQTLDAADRHDWPAARAWTGQGLALYPENPYLLNAFGYIFTRTNEFEKARQAYLQVLATDDLPAELKDLALNNVAYSNLQLEDRFLLAQADEYSAQAAKNSPWNPSLIATRGAVLVELGQMQAGMEMLKDALKKAASVNSKAEIAGNIALAELKRGNVAQAQKYLEVARKFDPKNMSLERVAKKIALAGGPREGAVPVR